MSHLDTKVLVPCGFPGCIESEFAETYEDVETLDLIVELPKFWDVMYWHPEPGGKMLSHVVCPKCKPLVSLIHLQQEGTKS